MKYELHKEEFEAIHSTLLQMTSLICDVIKVGIEKSHEVQMKRLDLEHIRLSPQKNQSFTEELSEETTQSMPISFADAKSVKEALNRSQSEKKVEPFSIFPEDNLTAHQAHGKDYLVEMLTFWLVNFQKEGEQPNRNDFLEELARDGHRAGAIVSYSMALGGLTKACWNALHYITQGGDVDDQYSDLQEYLTFESVRYIAGNITQVSSIHLAPLADEFEYPNPFTHMEEK